MARVRARLGERDLRGFGQRLIDLAAATTPATRYWDRLVVKAGGTTRFVRAAEIDWIEGAGVYATLHVGRTSCLYRAALSELAERLDPRRFVRVHRSAIVNLESVVQLELSRRVQSGPREQGAAAYQPRSAPAQRASASPLAAWYVFAVSGLTGAG